MFEDNSWKKYAKADTAYIHNANAWSWPCPYDRMSHKI